MFCCETSPIRSPRSSPRATDQFSTRRRAGPTRSIKANSQRRDRALRRARKPSRMTSLSVAYSPVANLDFTASAISLGRVILNCRPSGCPHLRCPGIHDINAAVLKVLCVARSGGVRSSRTSHCDYHGIELADRFTRHTSGNWLDIREHIRSIVVETQHLIGEVCIKNFPSRHPTVRADVSASAEQSNAVENFAPEVTVVINNDVRG